MVYSRLANYINALTSYHHVGILGVAQTVPLQVLQHLHCGRQAIATTTREWTATQGERGAVREGVVQGGGEASEREGGGEGDHGGRGQGVCNGMLLMCEADGW